MYKGIPFHRDVKDERLAREKEAHTHNLNFAVGKERTERKLTTEASQPEGRRRSVRPREKTLTRNIASSDRNGS